MTIRENNFQLNDVSEKWRSAKYRFDKMTFDIIPFRQCYYSEIWRFEQLTLDDMTFRQNDDSMKWRFGEMMSPPSPGISIGRTAIAVVRKRPISGATSVPCY